MKNLKMRLVQVNESIGKALTQNCDHEIEQLTKLMDERYELIVQIQSFVTN